MLGKTVNGWFKRNVQLWYQSNLVQDRMIFRHMSPFGEMPMLSCQDILRMGMGPKFQPQIIQIGWAHKKSQHFWVSGLESTGLELSTIARWHTHHHPAATGSGLLPAGGACPFTAALPGNKGTPLAFHAPSAEVLK